MEKLIISACICGAEVTKEQNPNVPYTVEEIVREAKSAYDAGASLDSPSRKMGRRHSYSGQGQIPGNVSTLSERSVRTPLSSLPQAAR